MLQRFARFVHKPIAQKGLTRFRSGFTDAIVRACAVRVSFVLALMALPAGWAAAQSPVCGQIRAELSQLGNTGGVTRQSSRLRTELGRIRLALQQNDCNRSGFLIFGGPPPVCSPLRAQAAQYEAQIRQMEGSDSGQRRAQLLAALDRYGCNAAANPGQRGVIYAAPDQPSLFERLFGEGSNGVVDPQTGETAVDPDAERRERLGGRMAICVRTCDGFFFPVNFEGIGPRDEYGDVCHSLCPGAETQVFFMPGGADLDRAATRDGTPYMSLPNAKLYQQKRDPACFCKQPGQTWASAMKGVEDLVEARKGDIIVTREQALAMSRPKDAKETPAKKGRKKNEPEPEPEPVASIPESAIPTGGTASSGIGPRIAGDRKVSAGVRQQVTDINGVKRTVRNVAPELTGKEAPIDLRGAARP
jgi:hypothetical protein